MLFLTLHIEKKVYQLHIIDSLQALLLLKSIDDITVIHSSRKIDSYVYFCVYKEYFKEIANVNRYFV